MRSVPLKKSIEHLTNKIGTKQSFYVNDFDKNCMQSVIDWYNRSQEKIKFDFKEYYKIVFILIRNEIELNRLQSQLGNEKELPFSQILTNIENKLLSTYGKEQTLMILDCYNQKLRNFKEELTVKNIDKIVMTEEQETKILELVEDFTLNTLLK